MSAQPEHFISAEEYLSHERTSVVKHEYFAGDVFALAGGSQRHNLIAANTLGSLYTQLRKKACIVYPSDMRIKVPATGLYTYPDITIVCGQHLFDDEHRDTISNPTVIIEILSPSTEQYDRGRKYQNYRTIPSFREYVLIAQDMPRIEHYARQANSGWLMLEYTELADTVTLSSIGCTLCLDDVYEKVDFTDES
jgi:Uma2 family endonuclease